MKISCTFLRKVACFRWKFIQFLSVSFQAMAIYTNLQNQNQELSDETSPSLARSNIDPRLMAEIEEGIQNVKDSEFKDIQDVGLARDSHFKQSDDKLS